MRYYELKMFVYNFAIVVLLIVSNVNFNVESDNLFEIRQEINTLDYDFSHNEESFTPDVIFDHYKESVDYIIWENREGIFTIKIREGNRSAFYTTKYFNNINIMDVKNLNPEDNYLIEVDSGELRKVILLA